MNQGRYPKGSVRALLETDLVSQATKAALEQRLAEPTQTEAAFFDSFLFATLRAVCARLYLGDGDPYHAAQAIDQRLAAGRGDGWRYAVLPPDGEAFIHYLAEFERLAQRQHATPFHELEPTKQDDVIESFRADAIPQQQRFFEDLLAETTEIAYSHPLMQEEIGYVGMADTRGWQRIGLDEHEPWEPEPRANAEFTIRNSELLGPKPEVSSHKSESHSSGGDADEHNLHNSNLRTLNSELHEAVDVVVIGTGAGGAPILARLAAAGLKVVALEAGRFWNAQEEFATDERAQSGLFWNDERLSAGDDPVSFGRNNSGCGVGGSTLHYTAYTPRAQPDDFRLYDEFGVGANWPIGYAELEPYYDEIEQFLGISGPTPYPWGPPRRRGYPLAPLPLNGAAQLMQRGCALIGLRTSPAANAALSAAYETPGVGQRHACTNRGFCQAGCSVGAKGSADVTFIPLALAAGAVVRAECFVTGFERDDRGQIEAVVYEHAGITLRQRCKAVFLCAGAIETPRLLLMHDLANSSGQVGRNFMAHVGPQLWAQFDEFVRPTKGIPGGLISEDTHRVAGADFAGGFLVQSIGVMPVTYASQFVRSCGLWGGALRDHMRDFNHMAGINILGECLPYEHNFVELSDEKDARGLPEPRVHFTAGRNERAMTQYGVALMQQIFEAAGGRNMWKFPRNAHIIGTCRMGTSANSAVVDADCRSFDIANLYICDNSVFPSSLSVNPALTIMALALRVADRFLVRMRDGG